MPKLICELALLCLTREMPPRTCGEMSQAVLHSGFCITVVDSVSCEIPPEPKPFQYNGVEEPCIVQIPLMVSRIGGSPMPRCRVRSEGQVRLSSSHQRTGECGSTETLVRIGRSARTSCFREMFTSGQLEWSNEQGESECKNRRAVPKQTYCQRQLMIQVGSPALTV